MLKKLPHTVFLGLILSACAGGPPPAPPAPPPLDPVGTYDFVAVIEGTDLAGIMTIRGSAEEGYSGGVDTDMGSASVTDVMVEGQTMTFYIPDVDVQVQVTFEGDTFSGQMSGSMGPGDFYGTKRSGV